MSPTSAELLRSAGLRRTPTRLSVLSRMEVLARPCSHAELLAFPDLSGLDDITLYRTLNRLVEAGLVHRILGVDGVWRYCTQSRSRPGCPGNHAHFLCNTCGAMQCLLDQPMPRVELPQGTEVEGRHFLVFGHCALCSHRRAT